MRSLPTTLLISLLYLLLSSLAAAEPVATAEPEIVNRTATVAEMAQPVIALPVLPGKWKGRTEAEVRTLHAEAYPSIAKEVSQTPDLGLRFDGRLDGIRAAVVYRFHESKLQEIELLFILEPEQKDEILSTIKEEWALIGDMSNRIKEEVELTEKAQSTPTDTPIVFQHFGLYKTADGYCIFSLQHNAKENLYVAGFRAV